MVEMRGVIQEIDGLVGVVLFSVAFVGLLFAYSEFGNSATTGMINLQGYISRESAAQHTLYTIEGSDVSMDYFDNTMNGLGYGYVPLDIGNRSYHLGAMERIAVVQGRMYIVEVNR